MVMAALREAATIMGSKLMSQVVHQWNILNTL
jgi:hypothetical protein